MGQTASSVDEATTATSVGISSSVLKDLAVCLASTSRSVAALPSPCFGQNS